MPTNILRNRPRPAAAKQRPAASADRRIVITAGRVRIRARLLSGSATADRLWSALPLYSTAETWGACVHFEVPIESGRERGARLNAEPGDICFWSEDDRVVIAFGETPISRAGEMRLPRPCNLIATALDDVRALKAVRPGEKVSVAAEADA